jgi:1,4-alpha-glucan branching enzyme
MYEQFGFSRSAAGEQSLTLFVPDNSIDPAQYSGGDVSHITTVGVIGDFQAWDPAQALPMTQATNEHGYLFTWTFDPPLADGFYEYKYVVTFDNTTVRMIGDPCTRYGGRSNDNSAFVIGGAEVDPDPIANRLATADLIAYELMIDDFTKEYRAGRAPMDAVVDKLDYLASLNINAIEFMPWIAWPDDASFSWGYDPAYFFSVESNYVNDPAAVTDRLSRLANLVSECHKRKLHVLLDIVLQHARQGAATNGFPYYWLWQDPTACPFVGQFVAAPTWNMLPLNYGNACTQQFVLDVCKYWLKRFRLDGFRFDQVTGFDNPDFPKKGAPQLIADLKQFTQDEKLDNISLILEDDWGYQAIADSNFIQPTGTWFDVFRSVPFDPLLHGSASTGQVTAPYMRVLNAARDFAAPICPVIYIENHDHATVTYELGSRDVWYKAQPYMIALATCSGSVLLHNGQEWGQLETFWEDDGNAPPEFKRVQSRPLHWSQSADGIGSTMRDRYAFLMKLRQDHPGLRSPNFYPNDYDWSWHNFSPDGYGIDEARKIIIYHRWGNAADGALERFMVVLNFSDFMQYVDIPLSTTGAWTDLINGNASVTTSDYWLHGYGVNSNWGCVFWQKAG